MLRTILFIAGKPGLYKLLSSGNRSLIVEDLATGRRVPVHGRDKVMSLGDIAMYTESEDRPLGVILDAIYAATNGEKLEVKGLDNDSLREKFAEFVPDFDRDRVYPSDIRKLFNWYNMLRDAGMESFAEKDEDPADDAEAAAAEAETKAE